MLGTIQTRQRLKIKDLILEIEKNREIENKIPDTSN